jgi:nucleoside 2-deoxyribosyltransferase
VTIADVSERRARRVYVASPLGFTEAGREFSRARLLPLIEASGHIAVDPWSLVSEQRLRSVAVLPDGAEKVAAWRRVSAEIADANRRALDAADVVVAVLDGADVDSGTAAEIGYAFARGKRIVGYRGDMRRAGENQGVLVNLQVEHFVRASGGTIVRTLDDLAAALREL